MDKIKFYIQRQTDSAPLSYATVFSSTAEFDDLIFSINKSIFKDKKLLMYSVIVSKNVC